MADALNLGPPGGIDASPGAYVPMIIAGTILATSATSGLRQIRREGRAS